MLLLWRDLLDYGEQPGDVASLCKPAPAWLSFSAPDTILYVLKSAIEHREKALICLQEDIHFLSTLYRKCYRNYGRGALLLYTHALEKGCRPSKVDYRTDNEALDIFDDPDSKSDISQLISRYDPNIEGILILITDTKKNATWFITVKLEKIIIG